MPEKLTQLIDDLNEEEVPEVKEKPRRVISSEEDEVAKGPSGDDPESGLL